MPDSYYSERYRMLHKLFSSSFRWFLIVSTLLVSLPSAAPARATPSAAPEAPTAPGDLDRSFAGFGLDQTGMRGVSGTESSSRPSLDTWVQSLEFSACILGREAPINRNGTRVAVGLPSRDLVL